MASPFHTGEIFSFDPIAGSDSLGLTRCCLRSVPNRAREHHQALESQARNHQLKLGVAVTADAWRAFSSAFSMKLSPVSSGDST